jgi:predicted nucleic acid-binding protein
MPVIDASAVVELLSDGAGVEPARERLGRRGERLWAPHLIDAEVGHALRRSVRGGAISAEDGEDALWELDELPLHRIGHDLLVHHAWDLRDKVSFYDGLYVALAEMLEEPLVTFDARLARAGLRVEVEVLPRDQAA